VAAVGYPRKVTKALRITYLDALRIIAAMGVVLVHAVNPVSFSFDKVSTGAWMTSNILNILGRCAVPIFVMISGALLLDRSRWEEPHDVTFRKRLVKVGIAFLFWGIVYFMWRAWGLHEYIDGEVIFRSVVSGAPAEHLYFLPLIAGLYAITPLLRLAIKQLPLVSVLRYALFLMLLASAWQLLGTLPGFERVYNIVNQFVPFVGYYVMGYVLANIPLVPREKPFIFMAVIIGSVIPILGTFIFLQSGYYPKDSAYYFYDFLNPFLMLQSVGLFLLARWYYPGFAARFPRLDSIVPKIAAVTFSVYLVHILVLQAVASYVVRFPAAERPFEYMLLQITIGGTLAALVAYGLTRTPYIKKLVT
jgi:surface polysaccharide O-acyltransferase-like enzyme